MLFRFWVFPDCTFLDISSNDSDALTQRHRGKHGRDISAAHWDGKRLPKGKDARIIKTVDENAVIAIAVRLKSLHNDLSRVDRVG